MRPFLLRVRCVAVIVTLFPVVVRWASAGALVLLGANLFWEWAGLGGERALTVGVLACLLLGLGWDVRRAWGMTRWESLSKKWGVSPSDLFLVAGELGETRKGFGSSANAIFHQRAIRQAQILFPRDWFRKLWERRWAWDYAGALAVAGACGILCRGWNFTRAQGWEVEPGNAVFARGTDVPIRVWGASKDHRAPRLEVKGTGGRWESRPLLLGSGGKFGVVLTSLSDPLTYRVRDGLLRRASYKLTPYDPPQLAGIVARVTPPPHTNKKPETFQNLLSIKVWAGSFVEWRLTFIPGDSRPRLSEGLLLQKQDEGWTWKEKMDKSCRRQIWAVRGREEENLVAEVVVEVEPDRPPVATLLGPSTDVNADIQDQIPMTLELMDDIGLSRLDFYWNVNNGAWHRERWEDFRQGTLDKRIERLWDLSPLVLKHNDRVDFYFQAQDQNVFPGVARTPTRTVNVRAYRLEQGKILEQLAEIHRSLRERVNEQRAILADLQGTAPSETVAVAAPNWPALITGQRQMARRLSADHRRLEDVLQEPDASESLDGDTGMEHHVLAEGISDISQYDVPEIDRALRAEEQPAAETAMDRLATRLETMHAMAEASLREEQTRAIVRDQEDLKNRAEQLWRSLGKTGEMGPGQRETIQEMVRAFEAALKEIEEKLKTIFSPMSGSNMDDSKINLRFDKVAGAMDRLALALNRSDKNEALSAAKEIMDELQKIKRQLEDVGFGMAGTNGGMDEADERLLRQSVEKVKELGGRQEILQVETMALVDNLRRRRAADQAQALESLRAAVPRWISLLEEDGPPFIKVRVAGIQDSLEKGEPGSAYQGLVRLQEEMGKEPEIPTLRDEAENLADRLTHKELPLADDEKILLIEKSTVQRVLAGDTGVVSSLLRTLAQQQGILSPRAARSLEQAVEAMTHAGDHLALMDPESSGGFQTIALEHLRFAESKLNESLENKGGSLSRGGGGRSGRRSFRMGGTGGNGLETIPKKEDFRSPGTFRQDIIDAMKESVPAEHQSAVQEYYRYWTK